MLTEPERARLGELRDREDSLSEAERAELQAFFKKIEDAEAVYLAPATDRLREKRIKLEKRNEQLREIARQNNELAAMLETVLERATAKRREIQAAKESLMAADMAE